MGIKLDRNLYNEAKEKGITFSQLLENMDPSDGKSKLSAFERQLKEHRIATKSAPTKGYSADKVEAFYRTDESKVLFPEFVATQLRETIEQASILPYLTSNTTMIDSNSYRATYFDKDEKNKKAAKLRRVTEASELPQATIKTRDKSINIYKYGLQVKSSYEAIRRMKIDIFARHIEYIGTQIGQDQAAEIIDVIINGDGNANTAAGRYAVKDFDTEATGLTSKAWVAFLLKFFPYGADTIVAGENALLQIIEMLSPAGKNQILDSISSNGSFNMGISSPQGIFKNVTLLYNPETPKIGTKDAIIALAKDYAVEKIVEAGSDISEADKFITNQTEVLTISENCGFATMYKDAMGILTL